MAESVIYDFIVPFTTLLTYLRLYLYGTPGKVGSIKSFDCDGLGQVAWLVDVGAAQYGDVIGE